MVEPGTNDQPRTWARRSAVAGVTLTVVAMLAWAAVQYRPPIPDASFPRHWCVNDDGARHFQQAILGDALQPFDRLTYITAYTIVLGLAWTGYALAVAAGCFGGRLQTKTLLIVIVTISLLFAVFCPPSLSTDCYSYVAYGRLWTLYGLNPYTNTLGGLPRFGDPSAEFAKWNIPAVYGPVWMWLSFGVVAPLHSAGLWWQVVAMKLLGAGALVVAALAGKAIADRYAPGRGHLALLAIGLNPLFIMEGPGNGHNDLLMATLILLSIASYARQRDVAGGIFLGLAVGIKFVPVAVLPWVILEQSRRLGRRLAWRPALTATGLALAPTVLAYLPLWEGPATLSALSQRTLLFAEKEEWAEELAVREWLWERGVPAGLVEHAAFALRQWPVIVLYLASSIWLWWRSENMQWPAAWVLLALALMMFTLGPWFPWYMLWSWAVALIRWEWNGPYPYLSLLCAGFGVPMSLSYCYPDA